jgi:hypothetical protein
MSCPRPARRRVIALATADVETLSRTADQWTGQRADENEFIDDQLGQELIRDVATRSAEAERTMCSIYCWIC